MPQGTRWSLLSYSPSIVEWHLTFQPVKKSRSKRTWKPHHPNLHPWDNPKGHAETTAQTPAGLSLQTRPNLISSKLTGRWLPAKVLQPLIQTRSSTLLSLILSSTKRYTTAESRTLPSKAQYNQHGIHDDDALDLQHMAAGQLSQSQLYQWHMLVYVFHVLLPTRNTTQLSKTIHSGPELPQL